MNSLPASIFYFCLKCIKIFKTAYSNRNIVPNYWSKISYELYSFQSSVNSWNSKVGVEIVTL